MSQLADKFVKDPAEIVKVQQKVMVTVTEVDLARKRIALSMKAHPELGGTSQNNRTSPTGPRPQTAPRPAAKPAPAKGNDWFSAALDKANQRGQKN